MKDNIPCSKSYAQRYILATLFSKSKVDLYGIEEVNLSNDVKAALSLLDLFKVPYEFSPSDKHLMIDASEFNESVLDSSLEFNCNESGTLLRMLVPILANHNGTFVLNGAGSLLNRKIDSIKPTFDKMNVRFGTNNGKLPIILCGKDRKYIRELSLDGSETSQYISGLIMAACLENKYKVFHIDNCKSLNYMLMTINVLQQFGYDVFWMDDNKVIVTPVKERPKELSIHIEKDWSSAAAYIVSKVVLREPEFSILGLKLDSIQSDKSILDLVGKWYDILDYGDHITFRKNKTIEPFKFDCTHCPDLFPVVCALGASIFNGFSEVIGLHRLVNKESNRGKVIFDEFHKYNVNELVKDDSIIVKGTYVIEDPEFDSHNDHRISMALIILRIFYSLQIPKEDKCLNKSYPNFIKDATSRE